MTSKNEVKLAYVLAGIFLVVGVLCYAAFSATPPEEPIRLALQASTGRVVFDHQTHAQDYGLECGACHHHPMDASETQSCGVCHNLPEDGSAPSSCLDCHDPEDFDISTVPNRADAFHGQCAGCHLNNGAGPMKDDCGLCHVR